MHVMRRLKSFASGRTPSAPDTPGDTGTKGIKVEQDEGKVTDEPAKVEEKSSGSEQHTISSHINSDASTSSMGGQPGGKKLGVDQLPKEVHEMSIRDCKADNHNDKDTETMTIKGNVTEVGQIITTKIGGRNSQPKQLPKEMHEMSIRDSKADNHNDKDTETTTIKGNGTEAGQIIITKIGGRNGQPKQTVSYMSERVVGTGSFGVVFQAKCLETEEAVAIKKVFQDKRYKNRELQIMQILDHPNVVLLKHYFFSTTERDELFLNLVLEYVPETVYRMAKQYLRMNQHLPLIYVRLYTYQICRALAYIHDVVGVCHRDIKPQNLLVNPQTHQVKLCDFGSAKKLVPGEPSISYICSRYYRAPELIFGATEYTSAIDMWSVGCVLAELLLGQPLFPGDSGVDQLVEIIKVLGTPTREEIKCMNPNYTEFKFPQIKARPWHKLFHKRLPPEAVDFVTRLLQYSPNLRCTALEACAHPFFDELRDPNAQLPNGRPFPPLFDFTPEELRDAPPELVQRLIPRNIPK